MAGTMRAVEIKGGKGELDALYISPEARKPVPAEGQVIVKIRAFGINRMDIIQRRGNYPLPPQAPATLGVEFSGVVESFGPGDHGDFCVGDEVFGLAYGGAYAEFIAVSSKMLLHKPAHLTFEQAAALPEAWITATQALHAVLGFAAGKSILWHAGASGVSTAGIQLSRLAGASAVYATAGSDDKCRYVVDTVGATAAFNYKTQDWADEVKKVTGGKGVDYIVDFVGGSYFSKNLDVAARDGRIVMLGTLGGAQAPDVNVGAILYKRLRIEGSTLRSRDVEYQGKLRDRLEQYLPDFDSGKLKIVIDTVLPWEQIQDAHRHMEEGKNSGKIVCTIGL
ncbi:Alcohol dehydrogenase superfamily, zinc-type [Cordyceps fumosorosea ARSEF 2679]|uniref:Alcohol dehydrogenase superfamily, zinc-type n=1 Tax=Cordyceps fumosorosea (strain ARSEF 2679) TaxID=1081104 RepID=A0A162ICY7_CORFA|nr:Alcohol dehydrogenase superfamily, zinc-type [Cordyceps fumosorosea ARSEF 2679]OAA55395.1 Alcohol dehydrogenase superfamily, zinc-type [Cordyceps fumosorosea ARSEF 2679]